jgi:hypothetical protein
MAWLLAAVSGWGSGGTARGSGGNGSSLGGNSSLVVRPGEFPAGTPDSVVLQVQFVPSTKEEARAQSFFCDLIQRAADHSEKSEIRAGDMNQFDDLLDKRLDALRDNLPSGLNNRVVTIQKTPFPGESVLRHMREKILQTLPNARIDEQ